MLSLCGNHAFVHHQMIEREKNKGFEKTNKWISCSFKDSVFINKERNRETRVYEGILCRHNLKEFSNCKVVAGGKYSQTVGVLV